MLFIMRAKNKDTVFDTIRDHPKLVTAAGALVGATVAAAGVMALKNEKTRDTAEKMLESIGEKASELAETMKEDAKTQIQEKTNETVEEIKQSFPMDKQSFPSDKKITEEK
jgi:gas vesicle protein